MGTIRTPFQGIGSIVRFNWHFYVIAAGLGILILIANNYVNAPFRPVGYMLVILILLPVIISLLVSFYVYDLSGFYKLEWLKQSEIKNHTTILNIHAGFDETSALLKFKFPSAELLVFDFYDPASHTEISIKRARKAYPPFPRTQRIHTERLPLPDAAVDAVFVIFAAHEIRNEEERIMFFNEMQRVLRPRGKIIVVEHLRDMPNFLAYNIGFSHFLPETSWLKVFAKSGLKVSTRKKYTPFISIFTLEKYGASS